MSTVLFYCFNIWSLTKFKPEERDLNQILTATNRDLQYTVNNNYSKILDLLNIKIKNIFLAKELVS